MGNLVDRVARETREVNGWRVRLEQERIDLAGRFDKLTRFMGTEEYDALPTIDRVDIRAQYEIMSTYLDILERRINRANNLGFEEFRTTARQSDRPVEEIDEGVRLIGGDQAETPPDFKA